MKKILITAILFSLVYANYCDKRVFSLHVVEPISIKFLLTNLVSE